MRNRVRVTAASPHYDSMKPAFGVLVFSLAALAADFHARIRSAPKLFFFAAAFFGISLHSFQISRDLPQGLSFRPPSGRS